MGVQMGEMDQWRSGWKSNWSKDWCSIRAKWPLQRKKGSLCGCLQNIEDSDADFSGELQSQCNQLINAFTNSHELGQANPMPSLVMIWSPLFVCACLCLCRRYYMRDRVGKRYSLLLKCWAVCETLCVFVCECVPWEGLWCVWMRLGVQCLHYRDSLWCWLLH